MTLTQLRARRVIGALTRCSWPAEMGAWGQPRLYFPEVVWRWECCHAVLETSGHAGWDWRLRHILGAQRCCRRRYDRQRGR